MRLKDKLFTMVDDQPHLNPVGINLPEFKALWKSDKSTDKVDYAKKLAYVYHMCEYTSPYYDNPDKQREVAKAFIGKEEYKPCKTVQACIDWYNKNQFITEKRALDGAIAACESIANDLHKVESESKEFDNILVEINEAIKDADDVITKIALMKEKLTLQGSKTGNSKAVSDLVGKIKNQISDMRELREQVTKAVYEGEMSVTIDMFIVDWIEDVKNGNS